MILKLEMILEIIFLVFCRADSLTRGSLQMSSKIIIGEHGSVRASDKEGIAPEPCHSEKLATKNLFFSKKTAQWTDSFFTRLRVTSCYLDSSEWFHFFLRF
jgi:hypothetical protein